MIDTNIDTLIERSSILIETLDKYVSGLTNQPISAVDWITLFSAISAALISGVSIIMTIRSDKKNRESNEKIAEQIQIEENKRAEASIDANLTANARIKWIQDVRHATAELIAACYKYIGSKPSEQQKDWEAMQEKKALFVLYFGPDDDDDPYKTLTDDLYDRETNKGKNDKLDLFIKNLISDLNQYHINHSFIEYYDKKRMECSICDAKNEESDEKVRACQKDEYGTPYELEDCIKEMDALNESLKEYRAFERKVLTSLQDLSEIMRIYIKIVWNRAKEGK